MLSEPQIERYSRQIIVSQVGGRGQQALLSATVAIVGCGDLSSAAAVYLAAAGVGRLTVSEPSPLAELERVNPDCRVSPLSSPLTRTAAEEMVRNCNVVLASGAAHEVCAVLNAACLTQHTPLLWGDTTGSLGVVTVIAGDHPGSPCYTCVHTQLLRPLAAGNAIDPLAAATAAFIGTLQATEAIKLLLGLGPIATGRLLTYDAVAATFDEVAVARDPHCATCAVVRP